MLPENPMKSGVCPECGSEKVYSGVDIDGKEGLRGGNRIPIDSVLYVALDNYVCAECGYTESYINDRGILNRIAREWSKVQPEDDE